MMERRALLAAALCLLVLVVYQEAVRRIYPPPPEAPQPAPTAFEAAEVPPGDVPPARAAAGEPALAPAQPADRGALIPIDTDLYAAQISALGGRLVSFRLKQFRTAIDVESEPLEMIHVLPSAAPPLGARFLADDAKFEDDTAVVYASDQPALALSGDATASLRLRGTLPSGASVEKLLTVSGNAYPLKLEVRSDAPPERYRRVGVSWRQHVTSSHTKDPSAQYRTALILANNKLVHEAPMGTPEAQKRFDPPVGWAGYADHYFLAALAPEDPSKAAAVVTPEPEGVQILVTALRGPDGSAPFTLYVGPKDVEILEAADYHLARAVDFGWFAFLAVPLLRLLKLFHGLTRNYGVDIILLTILVKVLFLPLSHKSMKSMRDMQRLQPQMAKLREKFKDDRERLNKEMIELYRRHRVNPLGGCLPMLLQFPVFIGLYQALNQSIELRHAKLGLWIRDLSTYECYPWPGQQPVAGCNDFSVLGFPIPVLVILMGASMILQQWLSPSTGMDPAQQRMMMILMPIMFTVMFVNFPSGLVLYWLVNNLLTIGQQWWTNRATA
jgi:YidC/Oxa1 family membrane protein insertase